MMDSVLRKHDSEIFLIEQILVASTFPLHAYQEITSILHYAGPYLDDPFG